MKDARGHGSASHQLGVHGATRPKVGGPHKVQQLSLGRTGQPWATAKSYGNKTVAESVANHMRTDGGYTRVLTK